MDKIMSYGLFCFAALNNRFLNCSARDKCIKRNQIKSKQTKFKSKLISHNIKWYFSNMGPLGGSQVLKFYSRNPTIIQRITKTTFVSFYFSNFKLINLNFISIIFFMSINLHRHEKFVCKPRCCYIVVQLLRIFGSHYGKIRFLCLNDRRAMKTIIKIFFSLKKILRESATKGLLKYIWF